MSKEEYLEKLSNELQISKNMLNKYIYIVGTNKENIKDYSLNSNCAITRKDNGFNISYTAEMLNYKDRQIADLEAKLAEKESEIKVGEFWHSAYQGKQLDYDKVYAELRQSYDKNEKLKQQLAEHSKHHEWVSEFLERYKIDPESTPEYSKNPMIEYCEQVYDFRLCDNVEIKELKQQLAEKENTITSLVEDGKASKELLKKELAEKDKEIEDLKAQRHIYLTRSVEECNKITELEFELQHKDQDKISFCIEKLEKVKEKLSSMQWCIDSEENTLTQIIAHRVKQTEIIDNQIKQLKEGK